MSRTPIVAIPGRFSASASALRYGALVTARALSESVLRAGGEPVTVHPWAPDGDPDPSAVGRRLGFADAVLLPGGGDLSPQRYGDDSRHEDVYDVDDEQDSFDLAVASWALAEGVPLLAVCRGAQVVNITRGGTLSQHMPAPHRHVVQPVTVAEPSLLASIVGSTLVASCYHHQSLDRLGGGILATAHTQDGTVEAIELPESRGWFLGLQWHPEDTAADDPVQHAILAAFVAAARS